MSRKNNNCSFVYLGDTQQCVSALLIQHTWQRKILLLKAVKHETRTVIVMQERSESIWIVDGMDRELSLSFEIEDIKTKPRDNPLRFKVYYYVDIFSTRPMILPWTSGKIVESSEYSSMISICRSSQKYLKKNLQLRQRYIEIHKWQTLFGCHLTKPNGRERERESHSSTWLSHQHSAS